MLPPGQNCRSGKAMLLSSPSVWVALCCHHGIVQASQASHAQSLALYRLAMRLCPPFVPPVTHRCNLQIASVCASTVLPCTGPFSTGCGFTAPDVGECSPGQLLLLAPHSTLGDRSAVSCCPNQTLCPACLQGVHACSSKVLHMAELSPGLTLSQSHTAFFLLAVCWRPLL